MSATPQIPPISQIEGKTIIDLIASGKRLDGRGLLDHRGFDIKVGIIEKANGSAQVSLGKTKVVVGVKVEIGEPFSDVPDQGVLTVNAELVPMAYPLFEPGPPDENSIELARVVDRGIRESKMVDLKKLCIIPNEKVFVVFVDIYVLDHDGNLIDASAAAAAAALLSARINKFEVKDGEVSLLPDTMPLPISNTPVTMTFAKIGGPIVLDPSLEEEQVMSSRLTVTIDKEGRLCALQKGGMGYMTIEDVKECVRLAMEKAPQIRGLILEAIGYGKD